jgi:hypothetical protein
MTRVTKVAAAAQEEAQRLYGELRGLSDQIRLKVHLGSADARDAWSQLEPQLLQFEQRVVRATDNAISEVCSAGKELKVNLERLRAELHMLDS